MNMNKANFLSNYSKKYLLLDGATGTNLQQSGLPVGESPEKWIIDNQNVLAKLQQDFYEAGSTVVYAFTFGANKIKLAGHGLPHQPSDVEEINSKLACISCNVRDSMRQLHPGREFYVAGDLAPTGMFLKPAGELDFDELVDIYRQQVRGLKAAGVDLFIAETMMDLSQTRAAAIAVREESELVLMTSVTVDAKGNTLAGNSFETCLLSLAALGVQAVGLNCSSGPELMAENMNFSALPADCLLLAKPNAGVPKLTSEGKTVFDLSPENYALQMEAFAKLGVTVIGGCCGTTPVHIQTMAKKSEQWQPQMKSYRRLPETGRYLEPNEESIALISSERKTAELSKRGQWPVINCENWSELADELLDSLDDEPDAICINLDNAAEPDLVEFKEIIAELQLSCTVPLIFFCNSLNLQRWIGRYYHGLTAIITEETVENLPVYFLHY